MSISTKISCSSEAQPTRSFRNSSKLISKLGNLVYGKTINDIWRYLLIFRCINACLVRTFFQPDEFYQSLEPAWQMAFGRESGAWITWEWEQGLRSSLHPLVFAGVYTVSERIMRLLACSPHVQAEILAKLPNLTQAYFAAVGDFYTWQLSEKIYGVRSKTSWVTLIMSILSPWQWFFATRTFSNSLEMSLTIAALYFWPWGLSSSNRKLPKTPRDDSRSGGYQSDKLDSNQAIGVKSITQLRICLLLAGTACILRPTNLLVWFSLLVPYLKSLIIRTPRFILRRTYFVLIREGIICSAFILLVSSLSDRLYYHAWVFPPYRWLYFNITQDLAVFYGSSPWHYYLCQGLSQILTTYLPFALLGMWNAMTLPSNDIRFTLNSTIIFTIGSLSLISHKEVRFIYLTLPMLLIIAAPNVAHFFIIKIDDRAIKQASKTSRAKINSSRPQSYAIRHKFILLSIILINILASFYITTFHQSGVLTIIPHIRRNYEVNHLTNNSVSRKSSQKDIQSMPYVAFLMPCHSTPFRSALIYSNITAWALTCSPPLHISPHTQERINYRDEADRFYDDPKKFLRQVVGVNEGREWPLFIVGFEGIYGALRDAWESGHGETDKRMIVERKRVFNSHWHDDQRRKGDVILWELIRVQGSDVSTNNSKVPSE